MTTRTVTRPVSAEYYSSQDRAKLNALPDSEELTQALAARPTEQALTAASPTIMVVDQLRRSVEDASGGRRTVLYTAKGQPCHMHVLPRFNCEDVAPGGELGTGTHPAFIVNGSAKSEIFIGAYPGALIDGEGISRPGVEPMASITYDQSAAACAANGPGWHLMSNWEWAAVALWCMANGYEPTGNTNWGRHHVKRWEASRRTDGNAPGVSSGHARTLTGSGPAAWAHDGTPAGITDLVGNVWEWVSGIRLQDGRVHMPADNHYEQAPEDWPAADLWFSSSNTAGNGNIQLVTDEGDVQRNGTIGSDASGSSDNTIWAQIALTGTAPLATRRALIAPAGIHPIGRAYARSYGARFAARGGLWFSGGYAGLAALSLNNPRSNSGTLVGFRPAFAL